jgi:hypothetical protein
MVWIERNLRMFQATAAVCAIVAAAIVLWFNVPPGRAIDLTRMKLGAVALPWLVGMVAFAPVLYIGWSRGVTSIPGRLTIRAFVAAYLAAVIVIFGGLYGHFVFQLF